MLVALSGESLHSARNLFAFFFGQPPLLSRPNASLRQQFRDLTDKLVRVPVKRRHSSKVVYRSHKTAPGVHIFRGQVRNLQNNFLLASAPRFDGGKPVSASSQGELRRVQKLGKVQPNFAGSRCVSEDDANGVSLNTFNMTLRNHRIRGPR